MSASDPKRTLECRSAYARRKSAIVFPNEPRGASHDTRRPSSLGSFISGIAVLASLVYLALQIRQNTKHSQALIQQGRAARIADTALRIAELRADDAFGHQPNRGSCRKRDILADAEPPPPLPNVIRNERGARRGPQLTNSIIHWRMPWAAEALPRNSEQWLLKAIR